MAKMSKSQLRKLIENSRLWDEVVMIRNRRDWERLQEKYVDLREELVTHFKYQEITQATKSLHRVHETSRIVSYLLTQTTPESLPFEEAVLDTTN